MNHEPNTAAVPAFPPYLETLRFLATKDRQTITVRLNLPRIREQREIERLNDEIRKVRA